MSGSARAVCLAGVGLLLGGVANAGSLFGRVIDEHNQPVANAPVRLEKPEGSTRFETRSYSDGTYYFEDVPDASYHMKVEDSGRTWKRIVHVSPGSNAPEFHIDRMKLDPGDTPRPEYLNSLGTPNEVVKTVSVEPGYDRTGSAYYGVPAPEGDSILAGLITPGGTFVDIWISDDRGARWRPLISTREYDVHPRWSPDGQQLVYQTRSDEHAESPRLWVHHRDGRLLQALGLGMAPTWWVDGESIVYARRSGGGLDLFRKWPNGSRPDTRLTSTPWDESDPCVAWINGTLQIVFSSTRTGHSEIWIMHQDGTNARQLTFGQQQGRGGFHGPEVSPDGTVIAFWEKGASQRNLWVMDVDGGMQDLVVEQGSHPAWSPVQEGLVLYFASRFAGSSQLWRTSLRDPLPPPPPPPVELPELERPGRPTLIMP